MSSRGKEALCALLFWAIAVMLAGSVSWKLAVAFVLHSFAHSIDNKLKRDVDLRFRNSPTPDTRDHPT